MINTVPELLEVLNTYGITQCDLCASWGEGMNIDERSGLMSCDSCSKGVQ